MEAQTAHANGKAVLIIDDDPTISALYENYLTAAGLQVSIAQDGESGLVMAKEHKPAIVLLDLMMPKINGIETLKQFKSDEELKSIPIIVITALVKDQERQTSLDAGAVDYIAKTEVTPKDILEKIHHFTT